MAYPSTENSNFKNSFKLFKQKDFLDFSNFINFDENECLKKEIIANYSINTEVSDIFGVISASQWKVYSIKTRPGLILIRNPFTAIGQRYWAVKCLKFFPKKPNKRNVDIDKDLGDVVDIWDYCHKNNLKALDKLRWATLGYHHNWDTKIYSDDLKSLFPPDLGQLGNHFATVLGYPEFQAQSAIINFYHPGSTLSGHVDSSEVDLSAPLLSFSFGQSAIFLIGGPTIHEEGLPILLQSGDVLLMSKEARLCYHAVPRIVSTKSKPWAEPFIQELSPSFDGELITQLTDESFWLPFGNYLNRSRVNMNIRQVLPAGQTSLQQTSAN